MMDAIQANKLHEACRNWHTYLINTKGIVEDACLQPPNGALYELNQVICEIFNVNDNTKQLLVKEDERYSTLNAKENAIKRQCKPKNIKVSRVKKLHNMIAIKDMSVYPPLFYLVVGLDNIDDLRTLTYIRASNTNETDVFCQTRSECGMAKIDDNTVFFPSVYATNCGQEVLVDFPTISDMLYIAKNFQTEEIVEPLANAIDPPKIEVQQQYPRVVYQAVGASVPEVLCEMDRDIQLSDTNCVSGKKNDTLTPCVIEENNEIANPTWENQRPKEDDRLHVLKLFVWEDFDTSVTPGLAFAIAPSIEVAQGLLFDRMMADYLEEVASIHLDVWNTHNHNNVTKEQDRANKEILFRDLLIKQSKHKEFTLLEPRAFYVSGGD